jgi:peptidyl-prolyl cis-trans isomerase D
MLNVLRESFRQRPYLKWVLLLVAASMILYLGSYFVSEDTVQSEWVARVNDAEIPMREFQTAARRMDDYFRQMFGQNYEQYRETLQVPNQALQALIDQEVIRQDARKLGLRVSKEELARRIRTDPGLVDANGEFIGTEVYLKRVGDQFPGGVSAFETEMANQVLVDRWTDLISQPLAVSDEELQQIFRRRTESTSVDYIVVAGADQTIDTSVGDDEARRWFEARATSYQRAESRRARFVAVTRESVLDRAQPTADEIQAAYQTNLANYTHPDQRRARHILLRVEAGADDDTRRKLRQQAEQLLQRVRGGEDFDGLARQFSQDTATVLRGGDLGFFGRGQMVAPFEEAVFGTPPGQFTPVVETDFGYHVIEVLEERAAGTLPLSEVEPQIRRQQQIEKAQDVALEEAARLRGEIASATQFDEVASRNGLEVGRRLLTQDERTSDLGASPDVLAEIFALAPGSVSQPLRVTSGAALVVVDESLPPGPAAFEEVASRVRTEIMNDRTRQAALAAAREALAAHGSVAAAAKRLGLEVRQQDLASGESLTATGGATPELQARLFSPETPIGDRGVLPVPAGAIIFEITGRQVFDAARFEAEKATLMAETLGERRNTYRQGVLNRLKERQKIQLNQEALARFR